MKHVTCPIRTHLVLWNINRLLTFFHFCPIFLDSLQFKHLRWKGLSNRVRSHLIVPHLIFVPEAVCGGIRHDAVERFPEIWQGVSIIHGLIESPVNCYTSDHIWKFWFAQKGSSLESGGISQLLFAAFSSKNLHIVLHAAVEMMVAINFTVIDCGAWMMQSSENPIVLLVDLHLFHALRLYGVSTPIWSVGSLVLVLVSLKCARVSLLYHGWRPWRHGTELPAVRCNQGATILHLNLKACA